ncbi:MAG: Rpn family recombination-promoting nuclease/putative transposase [Myxococcota bacterium]
MGEHDALFKRVFGVPAHAAGELQSVLPSGVVDRLDLDGLELLPGSFVDGEMGQRHTDLLFRTHADDTEVYVYFLLEHQSEPDPTMPRRIYRYVDRIWDAVLRQEPERATLPPVVPVILHHGPQGWRAPRSLHEMVDGLATFPELAPLVPQFSLLIDDLCAVSDPELKKRPLPTLPRIALWVLRDGRRVEALTEHLPFWVAELRALLRTDREDLHLILRYLLRVTGDTTFREFRTRIIEVAPDLEAAMGTPAEDLIQQGVKRGLEQGVKQGLEQGVKQGLEQGVKEGRVSALRQTLTTLLEERFGDLDGPSARRISEARPAELEQWLRRFVHAAQLSEVLEEEDLNR